MTLSPTLRRDWAFIGSDGNWFAGDTKWHSDTWGPGSRLKVRARAGPSCSAVARTAISHTDVSREPLCDAERGPAGVAAPWLQVKLIFYLDALGPETGAVRAGGGGRALSHHHASL
jgi:hypothetical protein